MVKRIVAETHTSGGHDEKYETKSCLFSQLNQTENTTLSDAEFTTLMC